MAQITVMKFLVVLAVLTLSELSFSSAAAIDSDNKEISNPMEDFQESLKRMLIGISKKIKENANFDDDTDFDSFLRENKLYDGEADLVTHEEEEGEEEGEEKFLAEKPLTVENDRSGENVDTNLQCSWSHLSVHCCQYLRVGRIRLVVCIRAEVVPPTGMHIRFEINGITIWHHLITNHHRYKVCLTRGYLRLCITIYHLYIGYHRTHACFDFIASYPAIHFSKHLGCFHRHFADEVISTANKPHFEKLMKKPKENTSGFFPVLKERERSHDILRVDQ